MMYSTYLYTQLGPMDLGTTDIRCQSGDQRTWVVGLQLPVEVHMLLIISRVEATMQRL